MQRISKYLGKVWNLPRTIYFNVKVFGFRKGLKLPVYITSNMRIAKVYKGCISIAAPIRRFMIELGEGGSEGLPSSKGCIYISKSGKLKFAGSAYFAPGSVIRIDNGCVSIGKNFIANKNNIIWCSNGISIGNEVLFGYNIYLRDDDGHEITWQGKDSAAENHIVLGNNIWCSANISILKGVHISDNCVVGYNSCVLHSVDEESVLVGGYPAKILKRNIVWKK